MFMIFELKNALFHVITLISFTPTHSIPHCLNALARKVSTHELKFLAQYPLLLQPASTRTWFTFSVRWLLFLLLLPFYCSILPTCYKQHVQGWIHLHESATRQKRRIGNPAMTFWATMRIYTTNCRRSKRFACRPLRRVACRLPPLPKHRVDQS